MCQEQPEQPAKLHRWSQHHNQPSRRTKQPQHTLASTQAHLVLRQQHAFRVGVNNEALACRDGGRQGAGTAVGTANCAIIRKAVR